MSELSFNNDELFLGYMTSEPDSKPQTALSSAPHASTIFVSAPTSKKSHRSIWLSSDLIVYYGGIGRGSRISNTAVIWAMQGLMNHIGNILKCAV